MSITDVRIMVSDLPRSLSDQVVSYADSIEHVLPILFQEAGKKPDPAVGDQVIFLAGIKKLHSLVSSSYWILDNSGKLLAALDVYSIRIGRSDLSIGGKVHDQLHRLLKDLEKVLSEKETMHFLTSSWLDIIRELSGNDRQ